MTQGTAENRQCKTEDLANRSNKKGGEVVEAEASDRSGDLPYRCEID